MALSTLAVRLRLTSTSGYMSHRRHRRRGSGLFLCEKISEVIGGLSLPLDCGQISPVHDDRRTELDDGDEQKCIENLFRQVSGEAVRKPRWWSSGEQQRQGEGHAELVLVFEVDSST